MMWENAGNGGLIDFEISPHLVKQAFVAAGSLEAVNVLNVSNFRAVENKTSVRRDQDLEEQ